MLVSVLDLPDGKAVQCCPPSAERKIIPPWPTAKQNAPPGQLTPYSGWPPLMVVGFQLVPPSDVQVARPLSPTATQVETVGQLMAFKNCTAPRGFHVTPPSPLFSIGQPKPAA